jgi:DNA-binding NarL/FixJ family response regulator
VSGGPIRVLLADDQRNVRGAFRMILDAQPDITVVAEAADGVAAVEQARQLRPDVVVVDIRMPRRDGLAVTRMLAGPDVDEPVRVIVMTVFDLDEYVHAALRNGACGFLLKRSGPALLAEAVRAAVAGDALISPQVTVRLLRHLSVPVPRQDGGGTPLTARELVIARLVAQGRTNAEITSELVVSMSTVKTHLGSVQRKLGARNRTEIAIWAWRHRLVH